MQEKVECGIYDAEDDAERMKQVNKTVRTVYANRPITLTLQLRNPLSIPIKLNSVRLVCAYVDSFKGNLLNKSSENPLSNAGPSEDFDFTPVQFELNPYMIAAVKLSITPKRPGQIIIKRVEWDILEVFRCNFPLFNEPGQIVDKAMEATL